MLRICLAGLDLPTGYVGAHRYPLKWRGSDYFDEGDIWTGDGNTGHLHFLTGQRENNGIWLAEGPRYSTSALQLMLAYLSLIIFWFLPFKFLQKYEPITTKKDEKDDDAMNSKAIVLGGTDAWWAPAEGAPTRTADDDGKAKGAEA